MKINVTNILLSDKEIKNKYEEIQKIDTTSYYHGYQHIINVLNNLNKFVELFHIDDHTADKLSVAVILHDIGRGKYGKGHEERSVQFAKDYFAKTDSKRFIFSEKDMEEIYEAIRIHEQKDNLSHLTFFQLIVNFVDKLDITKDRINLDNELDPTLPSYKFDIFRKIYLDVNEVIPKVENHFLLLQFNCNDNINLENLYSIPFMQVVDKLHKELANRLNLIPLVEVVYSPKEKNR